MVCTTSCASLKKSPIGVRARPRFAARPAAGAPRNRSSAAIASAKRSMTPRVASGPVRPMRPARSPPRTAKSARASARTAVRPWRKTRGPRRSRAVEPDPDRVRLRARSRAYKRAVPRAERRQSTRAGRLAGDEGAKLPEGFARPLWRGPWTPCISECATRRRRGSAGARRGSWLPDEFAPDAGHRCRHRVSAAWRRGARRQAVVLALGARGVGKRHTVLEHGLGQRDDVVARATVDERPAGAARQHQRLSRPAAPGPRDPPWSAPGRPRPRAARTR